MVYNMRNDPKLVYLAIVFTTVSQVTTDMTIWDQSDDGGFVSDVYHFQCNPSSQN